jgi:Peptidase inhibitor family I36
MRIKRVIAVLGAALTTLVAMVVTASPASAATHKNGVVEVGEFGLYYLQNQSGPVFDLFVSDSNFAGDVFPGTGISADNNTESYWNRDSFWWHVFTGANYTGSHGCLPPGWVGNASPTYRNTISSAYYSSSSC